LRSRPGCYTILGDLISKYRALYLSRMVVPPVVWKK
jgi:hypothetical protein